MAHYSGTVITSLAREQAFDYLADFSSVAEWDPSVSEASMIDPQPGRRGARFRVVTRFAGRDTELEYETLEAIRPHRLSLRAETRSVVSRDTITFLSLPGGGTHVAYEADLRLKGPRRILDLALGVAFRRLGENAKAGLERSLGRLERRAAVVAT